MNRQEFRELVERGPVFLDGATGTNLQAAGMKMGVCPEQWILENPQALLELQRAYVSAGTGILLAPTFTANRVKLGEYGLAEHLEEINRKLLALSREAAAGKAYVAADISMTGRQLYPIGDLMFEELVDIYREQMLVLEAAGTDLYIVETMMSLQECRAAVIAAKECSKKPVLVSLTLEENGRTLYGTDGAAAMVVLQSLGADAVGLNCSTGPDQMAEQIKSMYEVSCVPILVKPNAGLPELREGRTCYDLEPGEFARGMKKLARSGARIFGGCCGTTPAHIAAMTRELSRVELCPVKKEHRRFLASERKAVEITLDGPFTIVGERINPTGKKKLQASLKEGNLSLVCEMAKQQEEQGAAVLDINMGMNGIDEKQMMVDAIYEVTTTVDLPLCIDSSYVDVIEAALRIYPGRALINSISLEKVKLEQLLPIAKKYGAMFILLPLSDKGIPETREEKHEIIGKICKAALALGLAKEDIVVDGLVATVGANPNAALECLDTISYCRERGLATICGLSNISFGLPERSCINTAFLTAAITRGLTMAILNPAQETLTKAAYAADLLMHKEGADLRYINRMNGKREEAERTGKSGTGTFGKAGNEKPAENMEYVGERQGKHAGTREDAEVMERVASMSGQKVFDCVVNGRKDRILSETDILLAAGEEPGRIISEVLIPAINRVGDLFEKQIYFLPQLISGASAMQTAVHYLEPMLSSGDHGMDMATIVVATVEGDIHDIGKNLVVMMLKNYGYHVIDLGKDVSASVIVETAIKENASVIGLSALMTTTMMRMKDVVDLAKEKKCGSKIIIGGAAVTESFAEEIGAQGYSRDAAECVKLVERLLKI